MPEWDNQIYLNNKEKCPLVHKKKKIKTKFDNKIMRNELTLRKKRGKEGMW